MMLSGLMSRRVIPNVSNLQKARVTIEVEKGHSPDACKEIGLELLNTLPNEFCSLSEVAITGHLHLLYLPFSSLN
jgi:hypothetical protein